MDRVGELALNRRNSSNSVFGAQIQCRSALGFVYILQRISIALIKNRTVEAMTPVQVLGNSGDLILLDSN